MMFHFKQRNKKLLRQLMKLEKPWTKYMDEDTIIFADLICDIRHKIKFNDDNPKETEKLIINFVNKKSIVIYIEHWYGNGQGPYDCQINDNDLCDMDKIIDDFKIILTNIGLSSANLNNLYRLIVIVVREYVGYLYDDLKQIFKKRNNSSDDK